MSLGRNKKIVPRAREGIGLRKEEVKKKRG